MPAIATIVLCGSHEPRIWCALQTLVEAAVKRGEHVERFSADDYEGDSSRDMFGGSQRTCTVIAGDPGYAPRSSIVVLSGPAPSWASALPKSCVKTFDRPKPWEEEKYAVKFCLKEAERLGCVMSDPVAELMVRRVGVDVCVLRMELRKLRMLMEEGGEIEPIHLKESAMGFGGVDEISRLQHALGLRDAAKIHRSLVHVPREVGKLLGVLAALRLTLWTWLSASMHRSAGLSPQQIAENIGYHPYRYSKQVQPYLMKWTVDDITRLMCELGGVEDGCKEGYHLAPWVEFESILYRYSGER